MFKKLLSALGLFIAILIAKGIGGQVGREVGQAAVSPSKPTPFEVETALIEGFTRAAKQYNQRLPMMLDQDTRLDKASVEPGPRAVYHHTFPRYSSREIDANLLRTNLRPDIMLQVCASEEMKTSLQYGGIYVYAYSGNDGIEITRFEIDRNDCGYPETLP